jgi:hypothetical protein
MMKDFEVKQITWASHPIGVAGDPARTKGGVDSWNDKRIDGESSTLPRSSGRSSSLRLSSLPETSFNARAQLLGGLQRARGTTWFFPPKRGVIEGAMKLIVPILLARSGPVGGLSC